METKTKKCNRCLNQYGLTEFYKRKTSPDGFATVCKICTKLKKTRNIIHWHDDNLLCLKCKIYNPIEDFSKQANNFHRVGRKSRCKKCIDAQTLKRKQTARGHLTIRRLLLERWHAIKDRVKKQKITLDFQYDFLLELWEKQNGKCAISGIDMTYKMGFGRTPTNVSVDRINSNIGYDKNNIQLVCMAVNQMKNDLDINQLLFFCNKIIEHTQIAPLIK
jgi:hypothetical protein